jgi:hypothetical protein
MDRGIIPINKEHELQYQYYEKDSKYKYFNRKFEIIVVEKKTLRKNYKKHEFGVTTLNWNDIKTKFADYIVAELGERQRNNVKKAIGKLTSPKI